MYDSNNIFAKILRGEIPCTKVHEDEHTLAFLDINPQAPVHVLVLPKGEYISMTDFVANASDQEITALFRAVGTVAKISGVDMSGWRLLCNSGPDSGQDVPHFHVHICGGRPLGRLVSVPKG